MSAGRPDRRDRPSRVWRPGLRSALLGPVLVALLVGTAGLGFYVERAVRSDLVANVDDELRRATLRVAPAPNPDAVLAGAGRAAGAAGAAPRPTGQPAEASEPASAEAGLANPVEVTVHTDGSHEYTSAGAEPFDDDEIAELAATAGIKTVAGEPSYRAAVDLRPSGVVTIVALPLDSVDESIASLRTNLILGGLGLFVLQTLAVSAIAAVVTRPVSRLSRVATRIAEGRLDTPIGEPGGTAETAALASDLDRMVDRLRDTIAAHEAAASAAENAKADMRRFLADASHELKTPLTALSGYSDLYAQGMLPETADIDRAMARIGSESARLHQLVVDMLRTVDEGYHLEKVDLVELCAAVVEDLRAAHPDRAIGFDRRARGPVPVHADARRLHQAVLNLGANACQHTPSDVFVNVQVDRDDAAAWVSVVDTGPGIDPAKAHALFRPFTRGEASRSRHDHDGAGLGLAIANRVAQAHGADLALDETAGGGATFTLKLPLIQLATRVESESAPTR